MSASILAFEANFLSPKPIPDTQWRGVWVRGMLGKALKKQVCVFEDKTAYCLGCSQQNVCDFPQVFRPKSIELEHMPGYVLHRVAVDQKGFQLTVSVVVLTGGYKSIESFFNTLQGGVELPDGTPLYLKNFSLLPKGVKLYEKGRMFPLSSQALPFISLRQPLPALVDVKTKTPIASRYNLLEEETLFSLVRNRLHRLQKCYAPFDEVWLEAFGALSADEAWQVVESQLLTKPFHLPKDEQVIRVNTYTGYWTLAQIHPVAWEALQWIGWVHLGRRASQGFGNILLKPLV